jgi:hypothetical protein
MTTSKKVLGAINMVGAGRKEKGLQLRLERMQTEVALGQVQLDKAVVAGEKELERIQKTTTAMRKLKLTPVSDFSALQAIYDKSLKSMTEEVLAKDYADQATKLKKQFLNELNHDQVAVVDAWYAIKAKKELMTIKSIENVLVVKSAQIKATAPKVEVNQMVGVNA